MLRTVILAALALACVSSVADAKHRTPQVRTEVWGVNPSDSGCSQPDMRPCYATSTISMPPQRKTRRFVQAPENHGIELWARTTIRPARYISGRLMCAVNVNAELARRGVRGTGSALAKSFLDWGRASRPVAGGVAVYGRRGGGHVAIVSRVVGSRVYVWNPSSRHHAWREVEYRHRAIAYRVAGP